ncbi:uncharacterized protein LOC109604029 [Aethina tumida]|uniref:uncharacterized protein LOC109604029 n=1 Tax=Aethina tumida TaxID=116153 RepID=UPI00096B07DE|nr:uncharacterized protein LOC109604029 [Aethina tumida]
MKAGILAVIIVFIAYLPENESVLRCYKCLFTTPISFSKDPIHLCRDFDYSDKFIVECPYSTFCMKKITSGRINRVELINGTERDCAPQKLDNRNYRNGRWEEEIQVVEPYSEGCFKSDRKGQVSASIEYCYCKGDMCNNSNHLRTQIMSVFVPVILLLLIISPH